MDLNEEVTELGQKGCRGEYIWCITLCGLFWSPSFFLIKKKSYLRKRIFKKDRENTQVLVNLRQCNLGTGQRLPSTSILNKSCLNPYYITTG